jgi:GTP-binding protein HflX
MEREAIITDTVGFIRDLPPDLIRAFRATLEELEGADVLLHVVDISDPMRDEKIEAVRDLLEELHLGEIPEILIYNNCDLVDNVTKRGLCQKDKAVGTSAITREGLADVISTISQRLWQTNVLDTEENWLDYSQGKLPAEA